MTNLDDGQLLERFSRRMSGIEAEIPSRPPWRGSVRRADGPGLRFGSLFNATKFVVAGVVVALFGGFLLASVLTQPRGDARPGVGPSASPTAQVEPTQEAISEHQPAPTDADTEQADSTEQAVVPGTFSTAATLSEARWFHTATLLRDGRVLVVGGAGPNGYRGSAEIWDPETASFSPTRSLADPRADHTATLLPDGRVLIVGGCCQPESGDMLNSAEVWDPETDTFTPAGSLAEAHGEHTATLLPDGRVLIVGGYRRVQHYAQTAELWDPETESFGPADLLAATRYHHTATLLSDGRVLIVGGEGAGYNAQIADPPAEVWDPVTGSSSPAGSLAEGRFQHTATLLRDGRVLVVGGHWHDGASIYARTSLAEVWDPMPASFGPAGSPLVEARRGHTATLLPDGRVLVIGGDTDSSGKYTIHASAEIWDPDTASFSPAGSLAEGRAYHTATLLPDGRILVAGGGADGDDVVATAEIWEPQHGSSVANEAVRTASEPTTTLPIQLPGEIPEGVEWGTLETPLGQARWVHLTGDETTFPRELSGLVSPVTMPDGYVLPESGGGEVKLWRSPDLLSWTSEPLVIEARSADLSRASDAYWLNVHEPGSLWRSPDTKFWEQVSFEGLARPGPDGYAWTLRPGRPLAHGAVTIVPFEWATDEWVVARGLPGADDVRAATLVETAPGKFDIEDWVVGADSRGAFATVRFEETETGLRVLDHETGRELKVLEGVSMEFIKLLTLDVESRFDAIAWQPVPGLGILDGMTLVEVQPPLEGEPYRQAYTVDEEGFVSITLGPDGLVHMHRSHDGRDWREIDVIGDDADEPTGNAVEAWGGTVRLHGSAGEWTLTDGLAWQPQRPPVRLWTDPTLYPIGTGWLVGPFDGNPVTGVQEVGPGNVIPRIWFQPAEGDPVPIDITGMALPINECGGGTSLLGPNTIATHFDEDCTGVRDAWIITFDDVPA